MSEEEYRQQVDYVRLFLSGKDQQVLHQLIARMEEASKLLNFEEAARFAIKFRPYAASRSGSSCRATATIWT